MYQSKTTRRTVCTFNHDYSKEFKDVEAGVIPRHRLLLLAEHFGPDHRVYYIGGTSFIQRFRNWKLVQAILITFYQARFDEVFCTTESSAWFVLLFKAFGLLNLPVTVVNVALLRPTYKVPVVNLAIRWLLKSANMIVSYASFQVPILYTEFRIPLEKQQFLRFQVDQDFIKKYKHNDQDDYILSVGTNKGRDYETLLAAVGPHRRLIVCTDQYNKDIIVKSDSYNAELHDVRMNVPYLRLLALYSGCEMFISCLHDVDFSSGQTVIQEAMLLSKKVVVTDVRIVRDYINSDIESHSLKLVPVSDVRSLKTIVQSGSQ
jgi:hypothetical protein